MSYFSLFTVLMTTNMFVDIDIYRVICVLVFVLMTVDMCVDIDMCRISVIPMGDDS